MLRVWTGLVIGFLLLPLAVIVVFSFNARDLAVLPMAGPSLRWYVRLFASSELLEAPRNSLLVAMATTAVATVLGTAAAIGLSRLAPRTVGAARPLPSAPFMAPRLRPPWPASPWPSCSGSAWPSPSSAPGCWSG